MRRVLVVGMSGAGKTTAARRLAARLGIPFHEMDALAIGPDWSTPPDLVERVDQIVTQPSWVFDSWGYEPVRDAMWAAADTVVWLDYPARVVLPRLARRSLGRSLRRTEIFGGNRETWRHWLSAEHPFWYAIRHFRARRAELTRRTRDGTHLRRVRLTRPADFERWLRTEPGVGSDDIAV